MRILAIRGENLASLALPFEIDLGAEPLAGTGLFAITGDTGAGKSTILDALCLALYGDFPRAKVDRREEVIDPSGKKHQVSDPRHILRRGSGQGYAEVDFIGQDAKSYRARWQVRRARGKPTGKLQDEERRLDFLDGSGTVATGKTDVREAVIKRTGFTFDQFCRTVLLAQGEFDAFLLAGLSERAELLEKITGTDVYSRISIRVYEKTKQHMEVLEKLEQSLHDIGLMDEESRQQLKITQAQYLKEAEELNRELDRLTKLLHCTQSIQTARNNLTRSQQELKRAHAKCEALNEDRLKLKAITAAAPLRMKAENLQQEHANLTGAKREEKKWKAELETALAAQKKATENQKDKHNEVKTAQAQVKKFEPIWTRAAKLDEQLNSAQTEYDSAHDQAGKARQVVMSQKADLEDLTRKIEAEKMREADIISRLDATKAHEMLARSADHIEKLFKSRSNLSKQLHLTQNKLKKAEGVVESLSRLIKNGEKRRAEEQKNRDHIVKKREEQRARLHTIDEQSLAAKDENLRVLQDALALAQNEAQRFDKAAFEEKSVRKIAKAAEADHRKAIKIIEAIEKKRKENGLARREILKVIDLAEATLSSKAAELRSVLHDKEPCPVCGSLDHPFIKGDGAHAALAASITKRRNELDRQMEAFDNELSLEKENRDTANARLKVAQAAREAAIETSSRAVEEYKSVRPRIAERVGLLNLEIPLPDSFDAQAQGRLLAFSDEVTLARKELETPLHHARALRRQIDASQGKIDALNAAMEKSAHELVKDKDRLHEAENERMRYATHCDGLKAQLKNIETDLSPFLAKAGLSLSDIEHDTASKAEHIKLLGIQYLKHQKEREDVEQQFVMSALALKELKTRLESAQAMDTARQNEQQERAATLKVLQDERARLLDGEATVSHRTRITKALERASIDLEKASDEKNRATNQVVSLKAHRNLAEKKSLEIEESSNLARKAFEADCAAFGKTTGEVLALFNVSRETQEALRESIEHVDRYKSAAQNTVATRAEDLKKLVAANPLSANTDLNSLHQEHALQKKALDDIRENLGKIKNIHETDVVKQAKARALSEKIAAGQKDLQIWLDLDAAVGQKDGAKFRRFAQSVTLGHLIHLANDQLKAISPRYRLGRASDTDLSLHIIDRDMDEEVRASHSLSGGERFLVSLALALALSGLEGRRSFVDTLFIDEGFGSLDRDTLDMAIDALETLQGHGRKVGVITHVPAMIERLATQVRVEKRGNGRSVVRLVERGYPPL